MKFWLGIKNESEKLKKKNKQRRMHISQFILTYVLLNIQYSSATSFLYADNKLDLYSAMNLTAHFKRQRR